MLLSAAIMALVGGDIADPNSLFKAYAAPREKRRRSRRGHTKAHISGLSERDVMLPAPMKPREMGNGGNFTRRTDGAKGGEREKGEGGRLARRKL